MGKFNGGSITPGTIVGTDMAGNADVRCEVMRHTFVQGTDFNIGVAATPVTKTVMLYVPYGNAAVLGFHALVATPGSASSVTVDLQVNGASILSAPITLTNSSVGNTVYNATIANGSMTSGMIVTAVLTVSTSTGMQGVYCWSSIQETQSPV